MGQGETPEGKEKRPLRWYGRVALVLLLPVAAWETAWLALRPWMPWWLALAAGAALGGCLLRLLLGRTTRHLPAAAALIGAAMVGVLLEPAPFSGEWNFGQERMPRISFDGDRVRIEEFRDFRWRTWKDFDASWRGETFDLAAVDRCWLAVVPLREDNLTAHLMFLFSFTDGKALALSVEARRRPGQSFGMVPGLVRSFPLLYVFADPRDLLGLRARAWGRPLALLPLRPDPARFREVLRDALRRAETLSVTGTFYNTLTDNCTTTLALHASRVVELPWSHRIVLNGNVGEYVLENGFLDTDLPWPAVKDEWRAEERIRSADEGDLAAWMRAVTAKD